MIPVTGTQITSAVCSAIHAKYANIPIYKDPIDQEFEEPCFVVWCNRTDTKPVMWPRFSETHEIEVRYYPQQRDTQNSYGLNIGIELIEVLSKISVKYTETEDLPVFAVDFARQIVDDAVAVSITYKTDGIFMDGQTAELMGDLAVNVKPKE